ncbi:MAG: YggS family pyridoxal phosphate-dependent enzyme [Paludibacteraceae bacterium]|nr:YggS family pyridoxal phosphate-dependent enzyme [Paludibacteraceae bacterium]MBP6284545.1 YggS family pyridoxal phosphate-dependent enzyme [Paludibacteraceae bacterium]
MTTISRNIEIIQKQLPKQVRLVAVSKYNPSESILEAYRAGQRLFGESQAQEFVPKAQTLPADIEWHFIGHLQTNKVKEVVPYVSVIHAVDSLRLLQEINKQAAKNERIVDCLLQLRIAEEDTKFGMTLPECVQLLTDNAWQDFMHIRICGVMGMATDTDDERQVQREFHTLHEYFQHINMAFFPSACFFKEISMGMTHDYPLAIQEGATLIRVGSGIFGERMY